MSPSADPTTVAVRLTLPQRKLIAELLPELSERLLLDSQVQRTLPLSRAEATKMRGEAKLAIRGGGSRRKKNTLGRIIEAVDQGLEPAAHSASQIETIFRFKITLMDTDPPIWRRIEMPDDTVDALHDHIQTAMGWTNSHLHQFEIGGTLYGHAEFLDGWGDEDLVDSNDVRLSDVLVSRRKSFRFFYEYDFGDGWRHEIIYEGTHPAEDGVAYPRCSDGQRACPPEDIGGVWGYDRFLEAIGDPEDEEHEQMLEWVGGNFDPEKFDPQAATKEMRTGSTNWHDFA